MRDMELLETVQQSATGMTEDLEHLCYEEKLRDLELFMQGEEGAQRSTHQCL